jgi:hypothetical protein
MAGRGRYAPKCLGDRDRIAHGDASAGEEARVHLQGVLVRDVGRVGRAARCERRFAWHHLLDRLDAAGGVDVRDVERNARPIHPEAGARRLERIIDEEHPGGVGEVPALHEPRRLLLVADGELDAEANGVGAGDDANDCRVKSQTRGGRGGVVMPIAGAAGNGACNDGACQDNRARHCEGSVEWKRAPGL